MTFGDKFESDNSLNLNKYQWRQLRVSKIIKDKEKECTVESIHLYEVTVTTTGSILVKASSKEDAFDKVLSMSNEKIIRQANLCDFEPTDVLLVEDEENT